MPLSRAAAAAVLASAALAAPAAASVERCPDGQLGRVVVVDGTPVAACAGLHGCGEMGVAIHVNGDRVAGLCLPFHTDPPPDQWLCPFTAALAPGVPGVIDIRWEGDVYLDGTLVLDCPPWNG